MPLLWEAVGVDDPLASVTTVFGRLRKERDLDGKTRNGILCTLSRHGEHAKPGEAKLPFLRFSVRYVDRVHACHVSSEWDRQLTDLQRDALLAAGIDGRYLFEDHASGAKDNRLGLAQALEIEGKTVLR
jgi:hypothetical protein